MYTPTTPIEFWDAVDTVCGECDYLSEDVCATCPVRMTCDNRSSEHVHQ